MLSKFTGAKGSKGSQEALRVKRFEKLIKGEDKTKVREIEVKLLVPRPIPKYTGPAPRDLDFKLRSVKFVFRSTEEVDLLRRHIKISHYIENNTQQVDMVVALFKAIDEGRMKFDGKDFSFVMVGEEKHIKIKRRKK